MKHIVFHFDFVSPYAWLAFDRLPQALEGISHSIEYRPLLFAGLLQANGQRGPAEIPAKRDWIYRQVQWLAHTQGVALDLPAAHPFNPLPFLRLALACRPEGVLPAGSVNRYVAETVFRHLWNGGGDAADAQRLAALTERLAPARDPADAAIKAALRANTEAAVAQGVFGVPTMVVDGRHFWGVDALPLLRACLLGDAWFDGPAWDRAATLPVGVRREG